MKITKREKTGLKMDNAALTRSDPYGQSERHKRSCFLSQAECSFQVEGI